ncbi:putative orphan protein [Pseudoalteromonas luteoviolacea B = ATCC 29581]|nr:putative orphan protein [Pseudoalteromonas luteoviolacea B = ATCC 29581]
MPTFTGDEALNYDQRIQRIIPGYSLLHDLVVAQLSALFEEEAKILIVGGGTGEEAIRLAKSNPKWHITLQDISSDMLDVAKQRIVDHRVSDQVSLCYDALQVGYRQYDAVVCLFVLHFLPDNGDKLSLLRKMCSHLKPRATLFLADLMIEHTGFEREAQLLACSALGLTQIGVDRMRRNLKSEFYPLDKMRLAELLEHSGFDVARPFFQSLGFVGVTTVVLP